MARRTSSTRSDSNAVPIGSPTPEPFEFDEAFRRLRAVTAELPLAAISELKRRGHASPFEILVSSLISTRTRDETTLPVSLRLFAEANTPEQLVALPPERLLALLAGIGFAEVKVRDLIALSRQIVADHGGRVPATLDGLTAFRGIGPKVAALVLAQGFSIPAICVDVHVHRIVNRWGIVATRDPVATQAALEAITPGRYWNEINERLVPFGKFVCRGSGPRCPECPLRPMCRYGSAVGG